VSSPVTDQLPPTLAVPTVLAVPEARPTYAHPGDAGADLTTRVDVVVGPGERVSVPTGVSLALPEGYAAFVVPRSGLAAKRGLTTLNAPGTVDAGYRGEIRVTLHNTDLREAVELRAGDRVAQLVVQRVERVEFVPVPHLPASARGTGGHGSTGGSEALHPLPTPTSATPEERP
jgi:dUTP pyrophosphatase